MVREGRWAAALVAVLMLMACGSGGSDSSNAERAMDAAGATPAPGSGRVDTTATPRATGSPAVIDYRRLEKYLPTDNELPDRVAYAAKFDLSNEQAAGDPAQLKEFEDAGRLTGIQSVFSVEAGSRTVQFGISYYSGVDEPKKLLRRSGDPAAHTAPNRFEAPGLGDEYIAQRVVFGSGEAVINIVNITWVRGRFFIGLADIGGDPDESVDVALAMARLIDNKLKASPAP